ncbi:hypothetical protein A2773_04765 [Candidatus Gottesmanbacteria bacterium RIFCSPHIGHO2_01_FULL_39_10]|uniref:VTT domain-containing protein n=1 Tax=Candidatus Gottesmanbacteria bacterium RIFCSPHIGHO2_01_FULL_39_10 TaxID=1798375 RepID=A0A1F5ZRX7_9BACT|nr:MAG: hypothetical protein A2773_04765 [Candidatus Gottesmanbacteria bacterium RIFCSPHIGHO2_01_FULL_39_10]
MDIYKIIVDLYASYGYLLVLASAFLESIIVVGFFLPGTFVILLGGYFAKEGNLSIIIVFLLAWGGMVAGNIVNYFMGHGSMKGIEKSERLARFFQGKKTAQRLLEEYGIKAIFLSHIIGSFRSVICFTAGAVDYPFIKYTAANIIASFFWALFFTLSGYFLGESTQGIRGVGDKINFVLIIVFVIFIFLFVVEKIVMDRLKKKK